MPVSAAAGDRLAGIAVIADIKNGSERAASAITDILNGLFMYPRHSISIELQILRTVYLEYFLNSTHDSTPCITWETLLWESV